jgi:hypothetical protein
VAVEALLLGEIWYSKGVDLLHDNQNCAGLSLNEPSGSIPWPHCPGLAGSHASRASFFSEESLGKPKTPFRPLHEYT